MEGKKGLTAIENCTMNMFASCCVQNYGGSVSGVQCLENRQTHDGLVDHSIKDCSSRLLNGGSVVVSTVGMLVDSSDHKICKSRCTVCW